MWRLKKREKSEEVEGKKGAAEEKGVKKKLKETQKELATEAPANRNLLLFSKPCQRWKRKCVFS